VLKIFENSEFSKPVEIWDINAKNIRDMEGIPVIEPPFDDISEKYADAVIVITILDDKISGEVKERILSNYSDAKVYSYKEIAKEIFCKEIRELKED